MNLDIPRLLDRFDTAVTGLREQHDPLGPGFSIALVINGEAVRSAHHGQAQLEWPQPLAGDMHRFRIGVVAEEPPPEPQRRDADAPRSHERVDDDVACIRALGDQHL